MAAEVKIGKQIIGSDQPCFIIAEAGINHNGNVETAFQLIDAAAQAGADAVKFQSFIADQLVTSDAPKAGYQLQTTPESESQYEMLKRLELAPEAQARLKSHCDKRSILFMSSVFDEKSADFLADLGMAGFKLGSGELTNIPLLTYVARKSRPMMVSTGMAGLSEVEAAVNIIESTGNQDIVLLHCVSNYPAEPIDVNLRAIKTMRLAFGLPVGYSDHTLGIEVAIAAVALGASVIEKHFTLDRGQQGPDHRASLVPDELAALIKSVRTIEAALGTGRKIPAVSEARVAAVARRSLVAARDIPAGTTLSEEMITLKRPGTGLSPALRSYLVGRTTRTVIPAGTLLNLEMLV